MNLEKAPSNIRAIAASLWIIPAIILSYLFQNRAELFFLEIIYISALFSSIGVGFSELPFGKIFTVASILPCIANSYYFILLFPFNFQAPSLVDILKFVFLFILFSIPALLFIVVAIIPIFTIPVFLVSQLFILISDVIYTFCRKADAFYKICTVTTIIASIFIIGATVPSDFQLSPLPAHTISSQNESTDAEETETVYISTYGECYHSNPRCSGMKYARSVTLEEAQKTGRRACSKCYRKKH